MDNVNMQRRIEHLEKALKLVGLDYHPRPAREALTEPERLRLAGELGKVQAEKDAAVAKILARLEGIQTRIEKAIAALYSLGNEKDVANAELRNVEHDFTLRERPLENALREGAGAILEAVIPERIDAERRRILQAMAAPEPAQEKNMAVILFGNDEAQAAASRKRRDRLTDRAEALNVLAAKVSGWPLLAKTDKELEAMIETELRALPTINDKRVAN